MTKKSILTICSVTGGKTNEPLADDVARSQASVQWLEQRGVQFQPPLGHTAPGPPMHFLGSGKQLVNALFRHAES